MKDGFGLMAAKGGRIDNTGIFLHLLTASGQVMIRISPDGEIMDVFPAEASLAGFDALSLAGKPIDQLLHPDEKFQAWPTTNFSLPLRLNTIDGKIETYDCVSYSDEKNGSRYCLLMPARSGQKASIDDAFLEKAETLSQMGHWEYNVQTREVIWSDSLYRLYGLSPQQHPDASLELFYSLIPAGELDELKACLNQIFILGAYDYVHRIRKPDGSIRYIKQLGRAVANENGAYTHAHGTAQDVTAEMETQLKLQVRERKFRRLLENSHDLIAIIDTVGNYSYVSENVVRILGYRAEELLNQNAFDFIHPEDARLITAKLAEVVFQKEMTLEPFRFRTKTGDYCWISSQITNLLDDPEFNGLIVNSRDVTHRKFYQDQVRSLSVIAEEAPHCIVLTNADHKVIWVNRIYQVRSGYLMDEVLGKSYDELYTTEGNEQNLKKMRECLQQKKPFHGTLRNTSKTGKKYWVQVNIQPLHNDKGEVIQYFGMSVDITEMLNLENQLKLETEQRQKRVTSAIIQGQENERAEISRELHDNVNQILATVKLYLEMHRSDKREELLTRSENLVSSAINEIRKISKTLAPPDLKDVKLEDSIDELINHIKVSGKVKISFKSQGLQKISLSPEVQIAVYRLIQENLTNMLKYSQATRVSISLSAVADHLALLVKDNGIGFDTENKRTGIGINNMINRVETLNGKLKIRSAPGKGYTLLATIPLMPCTGQAPS